MTRCVKTDQQGVAKALEEKVLLYLNTLYKRPLARHTIRAFEVAEGFVKKFNKKVVLDSGCGTADSSLVLAERFPEHPVLGLDKSDFRLSKQKKDLPQNLLLLQVELLDFWRLALEAKWSVLFHALYYPNPWPKEVQLGRRFHAHPIFPTFLMLSPHFEMRTNWKIYGDEFLKACEIALPKLQMFSSVKLETWRPQKPETAFERKYLNSCQDLWRVITI